MKKTAFLVWLVVLTVLLSFSVLAFSVTDIMTVRASSSSGYYMVDTSSYKPSAEDDAFIFPDPDNGGIWSCSGMFSDAYTRSSYDTVFYTAAIKQDAASSLAGGVTFTFDLRLSEINSDDYSFLRFGIGVLSSEEKGYYIKIRTESDEYPAEAYTTVYSNTSSSALSVVTVDLSELHGILSTVRVTVYYNSAERPEQVKISSPFLSKNETYFDNSEKYLSADIKAVTGTFDPSSGDIVPVSNGTAQLYADYSEEYLKIFGKVYFRVHIDGAESGKMAITLDYCDSKTGNRSSVRSRRVELCPYGEEYVFPFEFYGSITGYSVELTGINQTEPLKLDYIRYESVGETDEIVRLGDVSKIELDGKNIRFGGTVQRDAAKQYSGSEIVFYAVPGNLINGETVELGRIRITTKFDYTVSVEDKTFPSDLYMFMAAIVTADGEIIPIEKPRYGDARPADRTESSILGLYGMATVGAFESNCSHVMVDVPLDRIITAERSAVSTSYKVYSSENEEGDALTRTLFFDRAVLDSLDEEINFYISAGIRVYLRFVSSSPIEGLTYFSLTSENYSMYLADEEAVYAYASVVRFLAGRYSGLDGFAVCTDAALSAENGFDISDNIVAYAENLAEISRITYNSALQSIENPVMIVPMSDGGDVSISSLTTVFADTLEEIGEIPWTLMYNTDSFDGENEKLEDVGERLEVFGLCRFDSMMTFLSLDGNGTPDGINGEECVELIGTYCENAVNMQAVIVSLDGVPFVNSRDFYSELKKVNGVGYVLSDEAASAEKMYNGSLILWDFYDKYYTLGWRAVGVDSFYSDQAQLGQPSSSRVLKAVFSDSDGASSGIMLKNFDSSADMTSADGIVFSLALDSDDEKATVVFVIGTDELRAEYNTVADTDGTVRAYYCDLSKYRYRDRTDFVGIIVYADSPVTLELGSVKLTSGILSSEELAERLNPKTEEEITHRDSTAVILVFVVAFLLTAVVFVLILTKEKETKDTKGWTKDEAEQYK